MNLALLASTALPFVVSPGASFTLTIGAAATGDRRAALRVWAGTALGVLLIAATLGFSGLAQLVSGDPRARLVLGIVGGAVLVGMGVASGISALRRAPAGARPDGLRPRLVLAAFVAVVTNVKAIGFYVLVVPTLRGSGLDGPALFLVFAAVHMAMMLGWLSLLGALVRGIPGVATSPRVRAALLLLAAATLVLLGIRTAVAALAA
ncbi:LysE family transporter [Clavibacter sp. VKM Ac-2873]|uniref:LysE family translocator n=1 Tax=Clavibacter sp. VKM Ac-2873 TaxID=2783813 RepID=UPI00188D51E4|nr:LysE family transporter [Clavibacter sp. VKM Ac-2873]